MKRHVRRQQHSKWRKSSTITTLRGNLKTLAPTPWKEKQDTSSCSGKAITEILSKEFVPKLPFTNLSCIYHFVLILLFWFSSWFIMPQNWIIPNQSVSRRLSCTALSLTDMQGFVHSWLLYSICTTEMLHQTRSSLKLFAASMWFLRCVDFHCRISELVIQKCFGH